MSKPQWVLDREREIEAMGPPPASGASVGDILGVGLGLAIRAGLVVLLAVGVYLIGRAVVG